MQRKWHRWRARDSGSTRIRLIMLGLIILIFGILNLTLDDEYLRYILSLLLGFSIFLALYYVLLYLGRRP
jgi:hypothetical protein